MGNETLRYFQFGLSGEFKIDSRRRILFKNDERIDISSKNFELLYFLIQNEGQILTHDEILDTVWHGTFVEQSNLKKGISALRHLLDESPNESLYIKTVPRRGYAFVAPVTGIADESEPEMLLHHSQTEILIEEVEEEVIDEVGLPDRRLPAGAFRSRSRMPLIFLAVAAIVAVGSVIWYFVKNAEPRFAFENPRVEKLTTDGNCYGKLSPDGNLVACITRGTGTDVSIDLQQLVTGNRRKLASFPNAAVYAIQFAPDGNFVYFVLSDRSNVQKSGVYKVSILGGESRLLTTNAASVIASDGQIAFTRSGPEGATQIFTAGADGQDERLAASFSSEHRLWDFKFSAGDTALLCSVRKQISDTKNVFYVTEIQIPTGQQKVIVPERETLIANASWMPDRASLILCVREPNADIRQIWQYFAVTGEMRRITNDNISYLDAAVSKDGKFISAVAESRQSGIWVGDGEGSKFSPLIGGSIPIDSVFWTRDGRLGYIAVENSAEVIRMTSLDGQSRIRVTDGKDGYWLSPALTGDGNAISMISTRSGLQQMWRMDLDGKNAVQITNSESPLFYGYLLSGDTAIYRTFSPPDGWGFYRQKLGQPAVRLNLLDTGFWSISPDEQRFAAIGEQGPDKPKTIVVQDVATGGNRREIPVAGVGSLERVKWTRDGNSIAFVLSANGAGNVYQVTVDGGQSKKITDFGSEDIRSFDWSFDTKYLAVVRGRVYTDTVAVRATATR